MADTDTRWLTLLVAYWGEPTAPNGVASRVLGLMDGLCPLFAAAHEMASCHRCFVALFRRYETGNAYCVGVAAPSGGSRLDKALAGAWIDRKDVCADCALIIAGHVELARCIGSPLSLPIPKETHNGV